MKTIKRRKFLGTVATALAAPFGPEIIMAGSRDSKILDCALDSYSKGDFVFYGGSFYECKIGKKKEWVIRNDFSGGEDCKVEHE